jgi:hypothetical protein
LLIFMVMKKATLAKIPDDRFDLGRWRRSATSSLHRHTS